MRDGFRTFFFIIALFVAGFPSIHELVSDQSTMPSTPESNSSPKFAMIPVGNYLEGYFSDVKVEPGASAELSIMIINIGSVPVSLDTYKVNALNGSNGGFVSGRESDEPVGPTTWIDYPKKTIHLEVGERQEIPFNVTVPKDVVPGQYITGLVAKTTESMAIPNVDILRHTLSYAVSVGILVPGELTYAFELGNPVILDDTVSRLISVPITNSGNYLVRPAGELTLTNGDGDVVLTSQIKMGSVYAGLTTTIETMLPEQMSAGDYTVDLSLKDEASGASSGLEDVLVTVPEPKDPQGVFVDSIAIEANADPIVFANVAITLNNDGKQIPASTVNLEVLHDGDLVESFPLATNQVLLSGENMLTARYIPAEMWESGTYTFRIVISAVEPNGGQETILSTVDVENTIVVP